MLRKIHEISRRLLLQKEFLKKLYKNTEVTKYI